MADEPKPWSVEAEAERLLGDAAMCSPPMRDLVLGWARVGIRAGLERARAVAIERQDAATAAALFKLLT
jgi:hypothetical protein